MFLFVHRFSSKTFTLKSCPREQIWDTIFVRGTVFFTMEGKNLATKGGSTMHGFTLFWFWIAKVLGGADPLAPAVGEDGDAGPFIDPWG